MTKPVETVARIIDPSVWADFDQVAPMKLPFPYSGQKRLDASLAKARDILALPGLAPASDQAENERLREVVGCASRAGAVVLVPEEVIYSIIGNYQVSADHHPNHVLIELAAFNRLREFHGAVQTATQTGLPAPVARMIHRALAGDFEGAFTATEQVAKIDALASEIIALIANTAALSTIRSEER